MESPGLRVFEQNTISKFKQKSTILYFKKLGANIIRLNSLKKKIKISSCIAILKNEKKKIYIYIYTHNKL